MKALTRREGESLLANLVAQRARLQVTLEAAMADGSLHTCVTVERAIQGNLELVGKLLGQLVQHHEVRTTSLLISPDYLRLRHAIIDALKPHPEAAAAVSAALHRLETEAGEAIVEAAKQGQRPIIDARPLEEAGAC